MADVLEREFCCAIIPRSRLGSGSHKPRSQAVLLSECYGLLTLSGGIVLVV